ncbi:MAG: class I SAM-dependent methyltransferase [Oscillatoriales cyanobacterium RM2_1_1]|nr:class I SAM-dependent methyltransferase [Oscillatoriales cyanobacterium SM2_3_0]NJO45901.1 class I SAM-dependent methyltransferase [Oscillatoriales cyanobacterium RM2_1_1]
MNNAFDPVIQNPALVRFIQDQVRSPQSFQSAINNQDEMYLFALENQQFPERAAVRYYFNGCRILDGVRSIVNWHFQGFERVSRFLDFASGYGRFTRFLIQELPPQKVWVSDILASAVTFQVTNFQVNGVISESIPADYPPQAPFDCILACSFFSHMPEKTFIDWMRVLYGLIAPGGLLLFSVHDRALLPEHLRIQASALLFVPASESRSLDVQDYGTTYVGETFVGQVLQMISQGQASYYRIPQGICRYQDLYIVSPSPLADPSTLNFGHHPQGRLEHCQLTAEGVLHLKGYISEINPNSQIEQIGVLVNGNLVHQSPPVLVPQGSGSSWLWSCEFAAPELVLQDILLVKAINSRGLEWVFDTAPLGFLQGISLA